MRCHSAASRKAAKGDLVGVDWQAVIFTRLVVRLTWIYKPPPPNKFVHLNHLLKSCHTARTLRLSQKASLLLRPCVWGCCWRLKWCRAVCFEVSAHVTTSPQTWGHIIPWISYILGSVRMSLGGAKQGPKHQRPINLPIRIQQGFDFRPAWSDQPSAATRFLPAKHFWDQFLQRSPSCVVSAARWHHGLFSTT